MSYQHGKAPADAPVTWTLLNDDFRVHADINDESGWFYFDIDTYSSKDADAICRAFHLAKLAGEAKDMVKAYPLPIHRNDWLRRYDAAKGEA